MGMKKPEFGFGVHLMVDGYGCDRAVLEDIQAIYDFLDRYPEEMEMTKIMPPYVFRYVGTVPEDWGISGFVLIAESHISIHTFPEKQYISVDMFSCNPVTLRAHGHDTAGVPIAEEFLRRLRLSRELTRKVCVLVETHMRPGQLARACSGESAWRRLSRKVPLDVLGYLAIADSQGRGGRFKTAPTPEEAELCFRYAEAFSVEPQEPVLKGRDLIAAGLKPGPHFSVALKAAFEAQLEGCFDKEVLLRVALEALARAA